MIHVETVTPANHSICFHHATSLVAAGSSRNLLWLAVEITVFLCVVSSLHGQRPKVVRVLVYRDLTAASLLLPGIAFGDAFILPLPAMVAFLSFALEWLQPQSPRRFMLPQSSIGAPECQ